MKLRYDACDVSGRAVAGVLEASSAKEATERLYAEGLYVTSIGSAGLAAAELEKGGGRLIGAGGRLKQLASLTRQLAVLTGTGTTVVHALHAAERPLPAGAWKDVVADVRRRVEEGESLVAAMTAHPDRFDAVYRSLISAGESGGQLNAMLERLSAMTRKQLKLRSTLTGAMVYPAVLLAASLIVVVVMLTVVLPKFAGLFKTLDSPVPPTTQALMFLSDALRERWYFFIVGAVGLVVGAVLWFKSHAGRRLLDTVSLRAPVVGQFMRSLVTARVIRTLGVLMEGKVGLLESLELTKAAANNAEYNALLQRAADAVTHGDSISSALKDTPLISATVYEAVLTGERSGRVGAILLNLAEYMDDDNEVVVKSLTSILEPLILIVLGAVVGFVAISMFLPLFDLTSAAQGGK